MKSKEMSHGATKPEDNSLFATSTGLYVFLLVFFRDGERTHRVTDRI